MMLQRCACMPLLEPPHPMVGEGGKQRYCQESSLPRLCPSNHYPDIAILAP